MNLDYIPPYSPNLNHIERLWKIVKSLSVQGTARTMKSLNQPSQRLSVVQQQSISRKLISSSGRMSNSLRSSRWLITHSR
ncbi:MAG: transposase [Desulfovibrionaceae bacterium]|nr:transposase [Desulfovibrionaceae bacterium]